jgi:hypothetical protein
MKYIISIILLIQIGTIIFQIRTDRKQSASIEAILKTDTIQNATIEDIQSIDTTQSNTLSLHQSFFIGVEHFGAWAVPILDAARPDTIPTWKEYASKHVVPKVEDNNKK